MNYCPDCGEPLEAHPGASFCPGCGSPVDAPGESSTNKDTDTIDTDLTPREVVGEMTESEKDEVLLRVAEDIDDDQVAGICRYLAGMTAEEAIEKTRSE